MTIDREEFGILAICAIRYCQGRMTYMPLTVQRIVKEHIFQLTDKDLQVMLNDCREQERRDRYGDPTIDKPNWIKWRAALEAEAKSRNKDSKK